MGFYITPHHATSLGGGDTRKHTDVRRQCNSKKPGVRRPHQHAPGLTHHKCTIQSCDNKLYRHAYTFYYIREMFKALSSIVSSVSDHNCAAFVGFIGNEFVILHELFECYSLISGEIMFGCGMINFIYVCYVISDGLKGILQCLWAQLVCVGVNLVK